MENFIVARYLYDQRPDRRYVSKVNVQFPGRQGQSERRYTLLFSGALAARRYHFCTTMPNPDPVRRAELKF
jgi:hypothetical protein